MARAFEQAAEIFFTGDVFRAFLVAEVGQGFIFYGEPLQFYDADIFLALFPNLTLAEFHVFNVIAKNLSPLILRQRRQR